MMTMTLMNPQGITMQLNAPVILMLMQTSTAAAGSIVLEQAHLVCVWPLVRSLYFGCSVHIGCAVAWCGDRVVGLICGSGRLGGLEQHQNDIC
jgi:hypothetical protein